MVAATYGSLAALRLLLALPSVYVNRRCGPDGTTALHCAASGGSSSAVDAVRLLLVAGADADATDAAGCRPVDVISVPPRMIDAKKTASPQGQKTRRKPSRPEDTASLP